MRLMREMRLTPTNDPCWNNWAGAIDREGTVPHWVLRITVDGPVDPCTGYLCDIRKLDGSLCEIALPGLRDWYRDGDRGLNHLAGALLGVYAAIARDYGPPIMPDSLALQLSPHLAISTHKGDPSMVRLTRSFEFSAAHRLFADHLSDEDNRRVFGKCSNPHGHGHNYILDVTLIGRPDDVHGTLVDPPQFDLIVRERILDHFDHKNLNRECDEFSSLNPSVENIARVIWRRLVDAFPPNRLYRIRVWETAKTYAEYDGKD